MTRTKKWAQNISLLVATLLSNKAYAPPEPAVEWNAYRVAADAGPVALQTWVGQNPGFLLGISPGEVRAPERGRPGSSEAEDGRFHHNLDFNYRDHLEFQAVRRLSTLPMKVIVPEFVQLFQQMTSEQSYGVIAAVAQNMRDAGANDDLRKMIDIVIRRGEASDGSQLPWTEVIRLVGAVRGREAGEGLLKIVPKLSRANAPVVFVSNAFTTFYRDEHEFRRDELKKVIDQLGVDALRFRNEKDESEAQFREQIKDRIGMLFVLHTGGGLTFGELLWAYNKGEFWTRKRAVEAMVKLPKSDLPRVESFLISKLSTVKEKGDPHVVGLVAIAEEKGWRSLHSFVTELGNSVAAREDVFRALLNHHERNEKTLIDIVEGELGIFTEGMRDEVLSRIAVERKEVDLKSRDLCADLFARSGTLQLRALTSDVMKENSMPQSLRSLQAIIDMRQEGTISFRLKDGRLIELEVDFREPANGQQETAHEKKFPKWPEPSAKEANLDAMERYLNEMDSILESDPQKELELTILLRIAIETDTKSGIAAFEAAADRLRLVGAWEGEDPSRKSLLRAMSAVVTLKNSSQHSIQEAHAALILKRMLAEIILGNGLETTTVELKREACSVLLELAGKGHIYDSDLYPILLAVERIGDVDLTDQFRRVVAVAQKSKVSRNEAIREKLTNFVDDRSRHEEVPVNQTSKRGKAGRKPPRKPGQARR